MKPQYIFLGILIMITGIIIAIDPKVYSFRYYRYIDFTGFNIFYGIFVIITGVLLIWSGINKSTKLDNNEILMCPICGKPIISKAAPDKLCPACNVHLEPLQDYYKRHPEQRNDCKQNCRSKSEPQGQ